MNNIIQSFLIGVLFIVIVAFYGLLAAVPVMLLWDWLMPTIFGLKTITLMQAWGLAFLCGVLFKSYPKAE